MVLKFEFVHFFSLHLKGELSSVCRQSQLRNSGKTCRVDIVEERLIVMVIVCHGDNENDPLIQQPTWTKLHYACKQGDMAVIQKLGTFWKMLSLYH